MYPALLALVLHTASLLVAAQLTLPSSPWLPPDISDGAKSSNESYPNSKWSTLLGEALYFYEAQRSGELPSNKRVSWRNSSALDDGREARVDLAGECPLFLTLSRDPVLTPTRKVDTTMLEVRIYSQKPSNPANRSQTTRSRHSLW